MPNDEDTLAHPEQPRFLLSSWLWAVVLFVFFGAIVAIVFGAMPRGSTYEEDRAKSRLEKLKTARAEWEKTESSYGWVDQAKGVAHIPIERAMELTLADLQTKKPMAAGPIATPAPAQVPVTATGAAQPNPPAAPAPAGEQANPPNAPAGTQPGASATPTAAPNSHTEIPPITPSMTPVQHPVGSPLPARGASATPAPPGAQEQ